MAGRNYDICMPVVSDLTHDARVWKEARTLARGGKSVRLIGMEYDIDKPTDRVVDGIDVRAIPFGSRSRPGALTRGVSVLRLWLEILRTKASAVHCHNIHPAPAALLAARRWRRPRQAALIYDAHELYGSVRRRSRPQSWLGAGLSRLVERWMTRRADEVITTNGSRAGELLRRHGRRDVVVLANLPEAVPELRPFDPGFPPDRRVLLYQGGIYATARAFREAIAALRLIPEFDLVIIGFGRESEIEAVRRMAREAALEDRVHILPPLPFDRLVDGAVMADVGLVPLKPISINSWLGDTNKLFEYLMAGLPVVGSDFPEVRTVLALGEPRVGEVFDPESPESIAAAVATVADGSLDARRREARRLALQRFSWETQGDLLLDAHRRAAQTVASGGRRSKRR